jgi:hypothetical protein
MEARLKPFVVPALSRDPYAVSYRLNDGVDTFRNITARGYGSRLKAGTTDVVGSIIQILRPARSQ